ncbi:MAG: Gfo/Idh/MocA family oxidoreductase [Spirochaetota bacterium]
MINVGLIGCGRISDLHALGYRNEQRARIYAVCDTNEELLHTKQKSWSAEKAYTDYKRLLEDENIHAVEILTPQPLHAQMVVDALQAGKHVQLQKPMAVNLAEADRICKAAESGAGIFKVADNYTNYPPFVYAKKLIDSGELGKPTGMRISFVMGGSGGWDVPASAWDWRVKEMHVGRGFNTFDHGHHLYTTAWYFMGKVEKVTAWIDSVDGVVDSPATVMWKYDGVHRYGVLDFQTAPSMHIPSDYYANDESVQITCEKGIIYIHRCTGKICMGPAVSVFDGYHMRDIDDIESDWSLGFAGNTHNFIDSILGVAEPCLTADQARQVLKFALAVRRSSDQRREVYLEEYERRFPRLFTLRRIRAEKRHIKELRRTRRRLSRKSYAKYAHQVDALMSSLLDRFDYKLAEDWNCTVGLRLTANGATDEKRYSLCVVDGKPELKAGELPQDPNVTLRMPASVWAAILLGKKKIGIAVLQGKIEFEGHTEEALKLKSVLSL